MGTRIGNKFIILLILIICFTIKNSFATVVDRIVAVVNDDIITLSELDENAAPLYQRYLSQIHDPIEREKVIQKIRKNVLQQMIDNLLVDQEAKRRNIKVTDEEIDHFIENLKRQNHLSDEKFIKFLADLGLSLEEYRQKIAEQIKRIKLIQSEVRGRLVITEEEKEAYFQKHYATDEKAKYVLAAIITQGPGAKEKIQKAYEELQKGAPFEEVARKYSEISGSGEGLGSFLLEELSPQIQFVVQGLKPGAYSAPVQIGDRWQIFKLIKIENGGADQSFEMVKPEIERKLYQEKVDQLFQKWLKELREKSYIRVLL